jgi:hypothetical protein
MEVKNQRESAKRSMEKIKVYNKDEKIGIFRRQKRAV